VRVLQIIKREIVIALSQIGLKKVASNYMGMRLVSPTIYGMVNGGYIAPGEFWMSDCLEAFIATRPGCVLDVGANKGVYLVKLRVITGEVEYYGVEPNPSCTFYLKELIRLNGFEKALILPFAFSDLKEVRMIYAGGRGSKKASAHLSFPPDRVPGHSFATYFTIGDEVVDTLDLQELAVIKIDVEGGELEALRGLIRTIERYRPYLYCEISRTGGDPDLIARARQTCELIWGFGYEILGVTRHERILETVTDVEKVEQDYYLADYIFSPPELASDFRQALGKDRR